MFKASKPIPEMSDSEMDDFAAYMASKVSKPKAK